jgi:hypothetical protein
MRCSGLLEVRALSLLSRGVRADQRQVEPRPDDRRQVAIIAPAQLEAVASPFDRYGLEPIRPRAFGLGQHQMIEINLIPIFGQRQAVGSRRCRDRSVGPCLA